MIALIWIFLLLINQAIGSSPHAYTVLRNSDRKLSNFLNNDLRKIMREKEPIYDPYVSKQQIIEYKNKKMSFKGKFNNFNIKYLSNYVVRKSTVNYWLRRVTVELNFPKLTSSGLYDIDAQYLNSHYTGRGHYNLTTTNFSFSGIAGTNMFGDLQVKTLIIKISLGTLTISATNENLKSEEKSKEWSENLSKIIPKMITDNHKAITSFLSKKLILFINDQINNNGMFN